MDLGIGLAIGIAGRAINSLLSPAKEIRQGQRLENLQGPKSSYGVAIPRVWGKARIGGNLIWATQLQEVEVSQSGGKNLSRSAGGTQSFIYFGTAAFSFCRNLGSGSFRELWANERLVWNADGDSQTIAAGQANFGQFVHFHPNGGNDSLFAVHQSITGNDLGIPGGLTQNETEAFLAMLGIPVDEEGQEHYPDHAYIVLDGLPLTYDYGNTFPAMAATVRERETLYCKDIISDLCLMAKVSPENIVVSGLQQIPIDGFILTNRDKASEAVRQIYLAQPFNLIRRGTKLIFTDRSTGTLWNIPYEHLGCRAVSPGISQSAQLFSANETSAESLPQELSLICYDSENYFKENKFTARREVAVYEDFENSDPSSITSSLVLSPSRAQQIVERLLRELWTEKTEYQFSLSRSYLAIEPGDAILVANTDWGTLKVQEVNYGANLLVQVRCVTFESFTATSVVAVTYVNAAISPGAGGTIQLPTDTLRLIGINQQNTNIVYVQGVNYTYNPATQLVTIITISSGTLLNLFYESPQKQPAGDKVVTGEGDTQFLALDVRVWNNDPDYTLYLLGSGGEYWRETFYYGSRDNASYGYFGSQKGRSTFGTINGNISATVDVTLADYSPPLISVSTDDIASGANTALIGDELIQFRTAIQLSANAWRLSNLSRALFGTAADIHSTGERFALLTGIKATVLGGTGNYARPTSVTIGKPIYIKAITRYQTLDDVLPVIIEPYLGLNRRPPDAAGEEALTSDIGNILISDLGAILTI
jgi:hypothetical protein